MDTIFSILHRMIGPIMFAASLSILYLLTDDLSAYVNAVKDNYADAYTYHEGRPDSFELDAVDGKYVLAMINNGADVNNMYYLETNAGSSNIIYALRQTTTGWQCFKSPINYHVVEGKTYSSIIYTETCSIDDVRNAVRPDAEYEVEYEYGENIGETRVIYRRLW